MLDGVTRRGALAAADGTGVVGGAVALFGGRRDDAAPIRTPEVVVEARTDGAGKEIDCRLGDGDVSVWFVHGGGEALSTRELVAMQRYGTPSVAVADCDGVDGTFEAGDGVAVGVPGTATVRFAYSPGGEPVSDASDVATLATIRLEGGEPVTR